MKRSKRKAPRGFYTKPNVWDEYREPVLSRDGERLDPGVNFFVLMLERLGLRTRFSCEGHPDGFYVTFEASYRTALRIKRCGFFSVEIEHPSYWSIRINRSEKDPRRHVDGLRWAADAWAKRFGLPEPEEEG